MTVEFLDLPWQVVWLDELHIARVADLGEAPAQDSDAAVEAPVLEPQAVRYTAFALVCSHSNVKASDRADEGADKVAVVRVDGELMVEKLRTPAAVAIPSFVPTRVQTEGPDSAFVKSGSFEGQDWTPWSA